MQRTPLLLLAVALPLALLAAGDTAGASIPPLPDPPPRNTEPDARRAACDEARWERRWDDFERLVREALAADPGDGMVLREIALAARDRGRLSTLVEDLGPGDAGLPLDEPGRRYLRGILQYYRSRYTSAREELEACLKLRPGWGWGELYLARTEEALLFPRDEVREKLLRVAEDPDAGPEAVRYLLHTAYPEDPERTIRLAETYWEKLGPCSWLDDIPALFRLQRALEVPAASPAFYDSLAGLIASWNPSVRESATWLIARATDRSLPPDRSLAFLRERAAVDPRPDLWREREGSRLLVLGHTFLGDSLLARVDRLRNRPGAQRLWTEVRYGPVPPDSLEAMARRVVAAGLDEGSAGTAALAFRTIGREDEAKAVDEEVDAQNPALALERRLQRLLASDPERAAALLDSVNGLGFPFLFEPYRIRLAESRGDTASMARVESMVLRGAEGPPFLLEIAGIARERGEAERARRLEERALALAPGDVGVLGDLVLRTIGEGSDPEREARFRACESLGIHHPEVFRTVTRFLASRGERSRLDEFLRKVEGMEEASPDLRLAGADLASALGEIERAEALLSPAEPQLAGWWSLDLVRAGLLSARGEPEAARDIYRRRLDGFPGDLETRDLLTRLAGDVVEAEEANADAPDVFAPFHHDLESTDPIVEAMVDPDTASQATRSLLEANAYVIVSGKERWHRWRTVTQVLTEEGKSSVQPVRVGFRVDDGVPVVRQARIVRGDGTTVPVSPENRMVTAVESEDVAVSDWRQLVVFFPGLEAGDAVDLAVDMQERNLFGTGWSGRYYFGDVVPLTREVVEVEVPAGTPMTLQNENGGPEPAVEKTAFHRIVRWEVENPGVLPFEADAPDVHTVAPWIGYSTYRSWDEAASEYGSAFWEKVRGDTAVVPTARTLTEGARGSGEKLEALFRTVTDLDYVAIMLDRHRVFPEEPRVVLERGYGDCKDKAALLISLLRAVGVEASPALVTPGKDAVEVLPGHVELENFTHMIVHVPGIDGGIFCDPTAETKCARELPPSLFGRTALVVPEKGPAFLETVPGGKARDHGYDFTIRVVPGKEGTADFEVEGTYRGALAVTARSLLAAADTAGQGMMIDRMLGFGLPESAVRRSWERVKDLCGTLTLRASFEDTGWADPGASSTSLPLVTEVADPFLSYPPAESRKLPFLFSHRFENHVRILLEESAGWGRGQDTAPLTVDGDGWSGRIRVGGGKVDLDFRVERTSLSPDDYRAFLDDWRRFQAYESQAYAYRRVIDEDRLASLREYVNEHPEDAGFALRAAGQLLGSDVGGAGDEGLQRRREAENLLRFAVGDPAAGAIPCAYAALIAIKNRSYRRADSLLSLAMEREPANVPVAALAASTKEELGELAEGREILRRLTRLSDADELMMNLIKLNEAMGDEAAVEAAVDRYFLLSPSADSSAVLLTRLSGLELAGDCERLETFLDRWLERIPEPVRGAARTSLATCRPTRERIAFLESEWEDDPLSPIWCNNLAWAYARAGIQLEQAEELARVAVLLSEDPSSAENTLAAVLARQGRWKEARKLFLRLSETDDRPDNVLVNEYFVGLCDYRLGKEGDATERWSVALARNPTAQKKYIGWVRESLDLARNKGNVAAPVFLDPSGSD